jgi:hypothetical protein
MFGNGAAAQLPAATAANAKAALAMCIPAEDVMVLSLIDYGF